MFVEAKTNNNNNNNVEVDEKSAVYIYHYYTAICTYINIYTVSHIYIVFVKFRITCQKDMKYENTSTDPLAISGKF